MRAWEDETCVALVRAALEPGALLEPLQDRLQEIGASRLDVYSSEMKIALGKDPKQMHLGLMILSIALDQY